MKIGILGSGIVAKELGKGFIAIGDMVMLGTRDTSKLVNWRQEVQDKGNTGSFKDAATFGEILVIATAWIGTKNAIDLAGINNFSNKIVIDVTNPLDFSAGNPPKLAVTNEDSGGNLIQRWLPEAKIVKAFNIINAYKMCNPNFDDGVPDLFIAGNEDEAKNFVKQLASKWGWKNITDMGNIEKSFYLETLALFWIEYGFKFNNWSHAFKLLLK